VLVVSDPIADTVAAMKSLKADAFRKLVAQQTNPADYPYAREIVERVPVYDCAVLRQAVIDGDESAVRAELTRAMLSGPGLVVLAGAFTDHAVIDRASDAFSAMIADQHARGAVIGDHYAKPGANDRVWNALEKLAVGWPEAFIDYYANDVIALIAQAWLGPGYQVTSQVNVVNPGGQAQEPHCDYHLGFLGNDVAAQFPAHVHELSRVLTLQGAVAHCDMPVESGPTQYLPYSQLCPEGYLAWRDHGYREVFAEFVVQLPLAKGDAVFFNPSLFHAAGTNRTTTIKRMANLLQISSAFGRAMETVDRQRMAVALYPTLLERTINGVCSGTDNIVAASAEWYPFPTNLDHDPPVGGLAPPSQAHILRQALSQRLPVEQFVALLDGYGARRRSV
jgi:ectoine hydroxylase-related dioxygenase (phytanoyl-CoA dioxygenase family)